ncbi:hypothetical protein [Myxosarcina sp. GI1(2024)]
MRYCLLSRFQGAWLGSILGEALVAKNHFSDRLKITNYQTSQWLKLRNKIATAIVNQKHLQTKLSSNGDSLALVLLPLILEGHESLEILQATLIQNKFTELEITPNGKQEFSVTNPNQVKMLKNVLLWGYAISLALKAKLNVDNPIEQILAGVEADFTSAALIEQLHIVNWALKQGRSLNKMLEVLLSLDEHCLSAIALSLYCFANTPQDFYLAVSRARSLPYVTIDFQQITAALTATLSGAYNSLAGIPTSWQMFGNHNQIYRQEQKTAVNLFNYWLGVYLLQKPANNCNLTVVATPKIIQPRSSLKIISQTDY